MKQVYSIGLICCLWNSHLESQIRYRAAASGGFTIIVMMRCIASAC